MAAATPSRAASASSSSASSSAATASVGPLMPDDVLTHLVPTEALIDFSAPPTASGIPEAIKRAIVGPNPIARVTALIATARFACGPEERMRIVAEALRVYVWSGGDGRGTPRSVDTYAAARLVLDEVTGPIGIGMMVEVAWQNMEVYHADDARERMEPTLTYLFERAVRAGIAPSELESDTINAELKQRSRMPAWADFTQAAGMFYVAGVTMHVTERVFTRSPNAAAWGMVLHRVVSAVAPAYTTFLDDEGMQAARRDRSHRDVLADIITAEQTRFVHQHKWVSIRDDEFDDAIHMFAARTCAHATPGERLHLIANAIDYAIDGVNPDRVTWSYEDDRRGRAALALIDEVRGSNALQVVATVTLAILHVALRDSDLRGRPDEFAREVTLRLARAQRLLRAIVMRIITTSSDDGDDGNPGNLKWDALVGYGYEKAWHAAAYVKRRDADKERRPLDALRIWTPSLNNVTHEQSIAIIRDHIADAKTLMSSRTPAIRPAWDACIDDAIREYRDGVVAHSTSALSGVGDIGALIGSFLPFGRSVLDGSARNDADADDDDVEMKADERSRDSRLDPSVAGDKRKDADDDDGGGGDDDDAASTSNKRQKRSNARMRR